MPKSRLKPLPQQRTDPPADLTLVQRTDPLVLERTLPYLDELPILDKNLYLTYSYNTLVFGGVNLGQIRFNARKGNGEPATFSKEDEVINFRIYEEPFIEFSYKSKYYSVEVVGQHSTFDFTLRLISEPTMELSHAAE